MIDRMTDHGKWHFCKIKLKMVHDRMVGEQWL